jgi:hypothetical protein
MERVCVSWSDVGRLDRQIDRERRKRRPARWKQNQVQSHTRGTKQGYATQSKAEPKTSNPNTGRKAGQNPHLDRTRSVPRRGLDNEISEITNNGKMKL